MNVENPPAANRAKEQAMNSKRFIAKKVGDRYQLVSQSPEHAAACAGWVAGGGLLALAGLWRRSLPGVVVAAAGGGMIYYGITGRNPLKRVMGWWNCSGCEGTPSDTPSYQHDFAARGGQIPQDEVDEAAMESFPASDSPAHTRSTAST